MIEFGKTLREARERKGYSISQMAELTRILPQVIEGLEHEDVSKIVAPIYGRGFVKLYCEQVGIDPKPLIAEFMEIYNGNRPPVIRLVDGAQPMAAPTSPAARSEESVAAAPIPEPAPTPAPMPASAPASESMPEPMLESMPAPEPMPEPMPAPEPEPEPEPVARPRVASRFAPPAMDFPPPTADEPPARDYRLSSYSLPEVPRSFWRFGLLAVAGIVVLVLLVLGARALYRVTMNPPQTSATPVAENAPVETPASTSATDASTPVARKPIDIPPLYID